MVLHSISQVEGEAHVYRDGSLVQIAQSEIVPGDVVKLGPSIIHCDMVLLNGETVVDESALTGEATPQAKAPIVHSSTDEYNAGIHKKVSLYAGTKILECKDAVAVVTKTASYTTKGELLREVIAFRGHRVKHEVELPIVIGLLATYSTIFFIYVLFNSGDILVVSWALGM